MGGRHAAKADFFLLQLAPCKRPLHDSEILWEGRPWHVGTRSWYPPASENKKEK